MELLLKKIFETYGLDLGFVEQVTKGFLSENFILADSRAKYFFKKYRFDKHEKIEEIHKVKKYFSSGGISVILPLTAQNGNTFFMSDGAYYALFPFVDGTQFERKELPDKAIESLGETLARMHILGKQFSFKMNKQFTPWNKNDALEKISVLEKEIKKKPSFDDFDVLALASLELKKKLISANSFAYEDLHLQSDHLIHGDYLDHNVFFGPEGKVAHVFDFEKTLYSPRTYELFRSFMYIFLEDAISPKDFSKVKKYLNAYRNIYPMSKDESACGLELFYLKSIHGAWVESEHYLKNNRRVDRFLYPDLTRIKFLSEHRSVVENLVT